MKKVIAIALAAILLAACAPQVGTEKWCNKMDDMPKGDWTANEAADFAKHCIFKTYEDDEE